MDVMTRRILLLAALLAGLLSHAAGPAAAGILEPVRVLPHIWALVGETGPRTAQNQGLNATFGVIVTPKGVILVDSGTTDLAAREIEAAIATFTDRPVKWVINTGAQDHRWLGNGYFAARGARIIALARTVANQKAHLQDHLKRLKMALGGKMGRIIPAWAAPPLPGDAASLKLGGEELRLLWLGAAHFPSDIIVWLPAERVVFAGDMVFMDRMLGIKENGGSVIAWDRAFKRMAALHPLHVIPGHGRPGDLARARRDTGDYLDWLVRKLAPMVRDMAGIEDVMQEYGRTPRAFAHLRHHETWHKTNLARAFVQMEAAALK